MNELITTTGLEIPGKKITKVLGVVKGNTIRARNIGRDVLAGLKNIVILLRSYVPIRLELPCSLAHMRTIRRIVG